MNRWNRATRCRPCKICGGPDNCTESSDGKFVYCGRQADGSIKQNSGGQFLHVLDDSPKAIDWLNRNPKPKQATEKPKPTRDWNKVARDAFYSLNAAQARVELSTRLSVSVASLDRLQVGWLGKTRGWTFPERDGSGRAIGINRRMLNGDKRRESGSQSGLTFDPETWLNYSQISDVHLVEGASDTAAMIDLELSVVGRPSNSGGVELLGELLKRVPADRRILVVGENDRRPHESLPRARRERHKPDCKWCATCWPGKFGAIRTAERLAPILMRTVSWAMMPAGFKDVRAWVIEQDQIEGKRQS